MKETRMSAALALIRPMVGEPGAREKRTGSPVVGVASNRQRPSMSSPRARPREA